MTLKIYNTIKNSIEEFIPGDGKKTSISDYPTVTMYSCGPTVYSYAHIGNFRTFIFNDFLRRYLKFKGFKIKHAMNITDVDDKTIAGSQTENISLNDYTQKYTEYFLNDLKTLNIEEVEHMPRATESINSMIDIIDRLNKKDLIYTKDGSTYFSIKNYNNYGKLSKLDTREIKAGARYDADEYKKDDVRDFALWKASKDGEVSWDTPYGSGRPGWHIECSAMIRSIFGSTIDIHTGGVDLIFPHHENEIAQSEAAYDEPFVRHWIHIEHLLVNGAKMSKSKGNFYTLRDLIEQGFSPRSIRYLLLTAHYRKQLNFTFDGLNQADHALSRIDNLLVRLDDLRLSANNNKHITQLCSDLLQQFTEAVDNDLNISKGIGVFFEFIHAINHMISEEEISENDKNDLLETLQKLDSVLGFIYFPEKSDEEVDKKRIEALIEERIQAKSDKNFQRSDEIRDMLHKEGVILEDTKDGTRWKIQK